MSTSGGAVGGAVKTVFTPRAVQVGGDITLHNSGAMIDVAAATGGPGAGGLDLVIAAATGDVLVIAGNLSFAATTAVDVFLDVGTIVAASVVNWIGQSGGTGAGGDLGLWFAWSAIPAQAGVPTPYTVQAGDISGGHVTLRMFYTQNTAVNRILGRSAGNGPLILSVSNLGH